MSQSEERGKWKVAFTDFNDLACVVTPDGVEYQIRRSKLSGKHLYLRVALDGMIDGLRTLQRDNELLQLENEALRDRDALRDRAEGQSAFDLQAQVEALKAARAADKAGFEVVIRELREEVARLKGGAK